MSINTENLLPVTSKDIEDVRKIYGKSKSDIRSDIEIIRNWIKKQQHLPQEHDDERLERFLLRNKFRLERTKVKLDNYFTLRAQHPEYFNSILDPESPLFSNITDAVNIALIPKLTPKKERVLILKMSSNADNYTYKDNMALLMLLLDIQISHDYAVGEALIVDFQNFTLSHLTKFTPTAVQTSIKLHQEGFSGRLTGVHYINTNSLVSLIVPIFKQVLSSKLFDKIQIHDSLESLYKCIPKECLPLEYGGEQKCISELHDDCCNLLRNERVFLKKHANRIANEKLRIGKVAQNDQFGMDGSFKHLRID